MPGFPVFLEAAGAAAGSARVKIEGQTALDGGGRNQVPDLVAADVAREEVDIGGCIGSEVLVTASMAVEAVGLIAVMGCGLYLHPPDTGTGVDPDVVGFVIAEGLADGETAAGGLEHELEFGQIPNVFWTLAAAIATRDG